jgi:hypothetical protein
MKGGDPRVEALGWIQTWLIAARRQVERIEASSYEDMNPDVLLYVQAVYNVRRGAEQLLGPEHPDVRAFDTSWPHLKNLRDMIEHFDEYVQDTGRRQVKNQMRYPAPFTAMYQKALGSDFKYVTIFLADANIEVHRSYEAAAELVLAVGLHLNA